MNVCVFCGSSMGGSKVYVEEAYTFGTLLGKNGLNVVYGGGKVGLMGVVADAAMATGAEVVGVIPDFLLKREVGHGSITRLEVVQSMHDRKKRMADLADAFVALPGGWGTLEELAEVLTWRQLGLISAPIAILNTNDFFSPLLSQLSKMLQEGFVKSECQKFLQVARTPQELLSCIYPVKQ